MVSAFACSGERRAASRSSTFCATTPEAMGAGVTSLRAPNGVIVELVAANAQMAVPATKQTLVVTRASGEAGWKTGRAGMHYRDLLPERHGGAFIVSHIRIPMAARYPTTCTFTGSGSRRSSAARAGCAWCMRGKARLSCSRPATAYCNRR